MLDVAFEEMLEAQFFLDGEDIIRRSTGHVVVLHARQYVSVSTGVTKQAYIKGHRLKFFLAFGWLPPLVDHRDRNPGNNLLANLRPATRAQNMQNRRAPKHDGLPRNVYHIKDSPEKPYKAQVWLSGQMMYLGCYSSVEAASEIVEATLREHHGDFYCAPDA